MRVNNYYWGYMWKANTCTSFIPAMMHHDGLSTYREDGAAAACVSVCDADVKCKYSNLALNVLHNITLHRKNKEHLNHSMSMALH